MHFELQYSKIIRERNDITEMPSTMTERKAEMQISIADETYLQEVEHRSKQYITEYCLQLQQVGYVLR